MADLTIHVGVSVEEAEADGSTCPFCGDMIFLKAFRLMLHIGTRKIPDDLLCQSCGELLRDEVIEL